MKPATSNVASSWGIPRPIIKSHAKEKWVWPWAREAPQNLESPFNISATAEASDFRFGVQLRFAKAHHKITPRGKSWRGPGPEELPKILGFPFNISAMAVASKFKFGEQLRFVKAHHKITPRGKSRRGHGLGKLPKILGSPLIFLQRLKLATTNLVCSLGLPRPIIKLHREEKLGVALG